MWHCERVDDGFFQLLDDGVESADVVKSYGNFFGGDNLHGNGLLVRIEIQFLYAWASLPRVCLVFIAVVLAMTHSPFASQNGIELACGCRRFGACFFFLLGLGVESSEEVADDKVGNERLAERSVCFEIDQLSSVNCFACRSGAAGATAKTGRKDTDRHTAAAAIRISGR